MIQAVATRDEAIAPSLLDRIEGACRFGMRTVWIRRGRQWLSGLQPPDLGLDHVADMELASTTRD